MILPSGYKRLLYIESTGTQYVDTGVTSNANTSVRFRAQTVTAENSTILLGSYGGTAASEMVAFYIYNGKYYYKRGGSNYTIPTSADTNIHSITWQSGSVIIDGTSYAMDGGGVATRPFYLFAHNNNGTAGLFAKARLYSCLFYDGSQLTRNFIPCQSDTGEIGLYDTVGGQFYGNKGTGVFIAGPEWWYDELEYIESSGTQYIDTGFKPNQDTRVVMDFHLLESIATGIFGQRTSASSKAFIFLYNPGQGAYRSDYNGETTQVFAVDNVLSRFVVDKSGNTTKFSGIVQSYGEGTFQADYSLMLFASNNAGVASLLGSMRAYSCQIYDNGTLVRDFVPAKLSDGSIGLIDKLTEEFYPNMGTGVFTAGRLKPSKYIELEYIQSSGTQYIDTGFKNNNNTRLVMDAQVTAKPSSHAWLFSARNSSSSGAVSLFLLSGTQWASDYDNTRANFPNVGILDRVKVDFNKNVISVNGNVHTYSARTFQSNYNVALFAHNDGGAIGYFISAKLYSCQIYDNGTLVRDYIPIKLTDGTVGLLDKVSGFFYGNAGTGVFAAGPAIATEYTKLEYVESTGQQYIDTQFIPVSGATAEFAFEATVVDTSVESWVAGVFDLSVSGYPRMRAGLVSGAYYTADTNGFTYNGTPGEYTVATGGVSKAGCTLSLYLFAQHEAANGAAHMANSKYRLHGAKFFVSDVLAMDLIPAIANGVPGMVDQLNNRFYPSNTAVMLVAGPEIADIEPAVTPEEFIAPYADFSNILLMWKAVPYAEGYNLYRDGELITTTSVPVFFDDGLKLQTEYSYSLTAFNASGESEPTEITASTTEFKLVTDRTAADVQAVLAGNLDSLAWYSGMKGAYNATDLNRVEAAVLFVIERLRIAGWYLVAQTKHWTFADFPTASEMQRYLDNVRLLRSALPVGLPMVPSDMNLFRYDEANTIESILERLDVAVTNIMQNVYYSSEIYSGEVR